jgi:hypothetical protein
MAARLARQRGPRFPTDARSATRPPQPSRHSFRVTKIGLGNGIDHAAG